MKKMIAVASQLLVVGLVMFFLGNSVDCYAQFAGGRGTRLEPWLISTPEHLHNVRDYVGIIHADKHFLQINDIDLDVPPYNTGNGWEPIGPNNNLSFRGTYNGDYHKIRNLLSNRTETDNVGLFGCANGATIENLLLESISVSGRNNTGGIVGYKLGGTIRNSAVSGIIRGRDSVGGITGTITNESHLNACHNKATIDARLRVGGITGSNFNGSVVRNSFSKGRIMGESGSIGGLIGRVQNSLTIYCYSTGLVTTPSPFLGGLIGSQQGGTTTDSYWNTITSGLNVSSGGEGRTTEQMTYPSAANTYRNWDFNTVWRNDITHEHNDGYPNHLWTMPDVPSNLFAEAGNGFINLSWRAPSSAPQEYNIYRDGEIIATVPGTSYRDGTAINYFLHSYFVTAFYEDWESEPSNTVQAIAHPSPAFNGRGTADEPFMIESAGQLSYSRYFTEYSFIQTADLDLDVYPWNRENGWQPIGYYVDYEHQDNKIFTGSFDGNGFKIYNLIISRKEGDYQGLFGYTQGAALKNIQLRNVNVHGNQYVGGLVGFARDTTIDKSSVSGSVRSNADYAGGLVGYSIGIGNYITNSFTNVDVRGSAYLGGLVGYSTTTTYSIANCYAAGSVQGTANCAGGLVGYSWGDIRNSFATSFVAKTDTIHIGGLVGRADFGTAVSSYWDSDTSEQISSAKGAPKTTLQLLNRDTFENWDFDNIWTSENNTYPRLIWQESCGPQNIPGPYRLRGIPGSGIVRLSWQPPTVGVVVRYEIIRDGEAIAMVEAPAEAFMDTNVTNYLQYQYRVVAYLQNDRITSPSNPVVVIPFTFAGGNGTINDPYLIDSAHQLHAVKSQLSGHFRQITDIDLGIEPWISGEGWEPIGTTAVSSFTGIYNGGGFRIMNLTINNPLTDYQGLFGYIRGGSVQNLGIENANVTGRDNVGGLAGRLADGSVVSNCYFYGTVTGEGVDIGGLVGTNRNSRISNCYSYGSVRATSHNVGGLVGWNEYSIIENSYSLADVEVTPITDFLTYDVGGLVGFNINNSLIRNCRAGGNVTATRARRVGGLVGDNSLTEGELGSIITDSYATGNVTADSWVGGLVGRNYSTPAATRLSEIVNSYSTGTVFSLSHNSGGLVGRNDNAVINSSYSASTILVQASSGPYNQGGLVGRNTIGGIINDCYATGEVLGFARVGGLIGDNFRDAGEEVVVTNSYSIGRVSRAGQLPVGGLIARNEGGSVTASYWNTQTSERQQSAAGEARNTAHMTYPYDAETFVDWDFNRIWTADSFGTRNGGYPFFRWQRFVTTISIRGNRDVYIPFRGENRYRYEARVYDHNDASMTGSIVFWNVEDRPGHSNVESHFVTIDMLGNLIVSANASEGSFIIYARSEADSSVVSSMAVNLVHTEVSPYPANAVNPSPQNRAEEVDINLGYLSWDYIEDIAYKPPLGFKIYFGVSEDFTDDYEWVGYEAEREDYSLELLEQLNPLTTYYWKVVPTTEIPDRKRGRKNTRMTANGALRGDAVNCPVWSFTTITAAAVEETVPLVTLLKSNYPNPFNPLTTVSFSLAEASDVKIEIYNSRGQKVKTLLNEEYPRGHHSVVWQGDNENKQSVSGGIYFLRMKTDGYTSHRKMLLLK